MEQGGTWQAFVSTGSVKTYLDYKKAQQKEEEHADIILSCFLKY